MKTFCVAAAMLGLTMAAGPIAAQGAAPPGQSPSEIARAFGMRETVRQATLSPDGQMIAIVASGPGVTTELYTLEAREGATPKRILTGSGKPDRIYSCRWAAARRLACRTGGLSSTNGEIYGYSTTVALDADGSNLRVLSNRQNSDSIYYDFRGGGIIDYVPDQDGKVLMVRSYVPQVTTSGVTTKAGRGLGVDVLDTRTGDSKRLEAPRADAVEYISDGRGTVRIMGIVPPTVSGYGRGTVTYLYRRAGSREWEKLSVYDGVKRTGFNPYAVDPDKNIVYGFENIDGRSAFVSYALDGSLKRTIVSQRADVDAASPIMVGRENRVVGVSYVTDRREAEVFDEGLKKLTGALSKALGGRAISIIDTTSDGGRVLIYANSDTDPGQYYLFDTRARRLSPVMPDRPAMVGRTLAEQQSVTYRASDGTSIPAYLTLPPGRTMKDAKSLPAIVMPHGGPESRDEWGFDWLSQYFAARGYVVIQPQFRGSAGFGQRWLLENGFRSWRTAIGDVLDAGRWLVKEGIADPSKLAIVGWSYGGYAALQSASVDPALFKAVVAVAPVTDLDSLVKRQDFSSDYYLQRDYLGSGFNAREGSPAQNVGKIAAPVLMFHGTMDANVPVGQARLMDAKLRGAGKRSTLVIYDGLDHQLDDSNARAELLEKSDAFIRAATGG